MSSESSVGPDLNLSFFSLSLVIFLSLFLSLYLPLFLSISYSLIAKIVCKKICKIFASELGFKYVVMRGFQKGITLSGRPSGSA